MKLCNNFPIFVANRIIGLFNFREPIYIIRDPDVIRQLTIKDFDYFEDRHSFIDSDSDKLFGNSLFLLRGKRWRDMRSTLSPTFTGNKMRQMFELVSDCAEDVSTYLLKEADANQKIEWEVKDLFSRYGNDVIASCAFGLKVNSLEDDKNEIYTIGARLLDFNSLKVTLRVLLLMMFPRLMKTLNIELFDKSDSSFFRSLVLDTMNNRAKKNIIRSDMINQLMQVRNGSNEYRIAAETTSFAMVEESDIGRREVKRRWSDDELVAQCFLFFSAGYDTTVTLLSFLCYELTVNPNIQARLFDEILAVSKRIVGRRVDFDLLKSMKYMDQVVSEALRLWPPILKVERLCSRDYLFDDGVDTRFHIEKGRVVWIPISTIHRDPNYWPEPDKFDPERFSDENKSNIIPGTFLAFGIGPRNCIGESHCFLQSVKSASNVIFCL